MALGTRRARGGFTLVEVLFVILIIFLLMGLLIGGIRYASRFSKGVADLNAVKALGEGANHFKQQFGFLPPLVRDGYDASAAAPTGGPLTTGTPQKILVYSVSDPGPPSHLSYLKGTAVGGGRGPDMRFSLYSIPYYLLGALDQPLDGKDGLGFKAPKRDGTFEQAGRVFDPFYDIGTNAKAIFETQANKGKIELRDTHGVAFRYYRWMNGDNNNNVVTAADLHIPVMVSGPNPGPDVKAAEAAIVAAGPNGLFGDEFELTPATGPGAHPQYMKIEDMAVKLSISGDPVNDPKVRQQVLDAARADNIVEVLK